MPGAGTVEALTLNEALDRAGLDSVDLVKIDIEGGECTSSGERGTGRAGLAILGEVHPPLTVPRALEQLAPYGFVPLPVPRRPIFEDLLFAHRAR